MSEKITDELPASRLHEIIAEQTAELIRLRFMHGNLKAQNEILCEQIAILKSQKLAILADIQSKISKALI